MKNLLFFTVLGALLFITACSDEKPVSYPFYKATPRTEIPVSYDEFMEGKKETQSPATFVFHALNEKVHQLTTKITLLKSDGSPSSCTVVATNHFELFGEVFIESKEPDVTKTGDCSGIRDYYLCDARVSDIPEKIKVLAKDCIGVIYVEEKKMEDNKAKEIIGIKIGIRPQLHHNPVTEYHSLIETSKDRIPSLYKFTDQDLEKSQGNYKVNCQQRDHILSCSLKETLGKVSVTAITYGRWSLVNSDKATWLELQKNETGSIAVEFAKGITFEEFYTGVQKAFSVLGQGCKPNMGSTELRDWFNNELSYKKFECMSLVFMPIEAVHPTLKGEIDYQGIMNSMMDSYGKHDKMK